MKVFRSILDRIVDSQLYEQVVYRKRILFESDTSYVVRQFRNAVGRPPELKFPMMFCDKITWLLLNYRNPLCTTLADKFAVRSYVEDRVGKKILIPLIGVYAKTKHIPWNSLPSSFVLKATHGCRWNIICKSKDDFDKRAASKKLARWLRHNYYWYGREWVYRDIPPRIIAEDYISGDDGNSPPDYKIFCFDGVPRLIQVDAGRFLDHRRSFFSAEWEPFPGQMTFPPIDGLLDKPSNLAQMIDISRKLSDGLPFVRVDLYDTGDRVYFGEMTFLPGRGIEPFNSEEHNRLVGDWISLPEPITEGSWGHVKALI